MKNIWAFIGTFTLVLGLHAQSYKLEGIVTDTEGSPLIGASVINLKTFTGAVTNRDGSFSLKLKSGEQVVKVEYLGFKSVVDTFLVDADFKHDFVLDVKPLLSKEFVVEATRASANTPIAFQDISKAELEENNLAQDMPILLNQTVSAVTTSDAGAGVGYTGIRIRGSDATRINVSVNGVPLNDAESHGVFWVNMPDFASTTENIQIQRGVGTSTNGAAAFGASINLETSDLDSNASVELNNTYGSFNTRRHNAVINSGLINDHFNFEGRLSYIGSDGYIDRSAADLRSYYFAGGYYGKKMMVKALTFAGKEVTQQAWWGTPQSRLQGDRDAMLNHALNNGYTEAQTTNLLESGRTYNYYEYNNEVDNYAQDHYQLITGWQLSDHLYLNLTGHYTYGRGYFEQYKSDDAFSDYGLSNPVIGTDTIFSSDIIVRRWLENHFYGGVYSLQYNKAGNRITLGGSYNEYQGDHFGEVIWAEYAVNTEIRERYYASKSRKSDASSYLKWEYALNKLSLFADVQGRFIDYTSAGVDNDQRNIQIDEDYLFLNPKLGLNVRINNQQDVYASIARASREPVRSDFTDALAGAKPQPEYLTDAEAGWRFRSGNVSTSINTYYMHYTDQLVLTGEVNDVGSPIRRNVPNSYRAGIELSSHIKLPYGFYWQPNVTFSQNKIVSFTEVLYDYTEGFDIVEVEHSNTDIAFSPWLVGFSEIGFKTKFGFELAVLTKYVGEQFLDNTSDPNRKIDPYLVNDVRLTYQPKVAQLKRLQLTLLINNVLNEMYASNGYTYSYYYAGLITENFYYPQAGTNFLVGLKLKI